MTLSRMLATILVAGAVAAPTVAAQPIDTGPVSQASTNQDPRYAGTHVRTSALAQERYYSSYGAKPDGRAQDLRSPDARDSADGRGAFNAPEVTVVRVPQSAPSRSGIDWGDAGIGAGIVLGLTLLALGGAFAVVHRRQARAAAAAG
jgi:hypothetical protein